MVINYFPIDIITESTMISASERDFSSDSTVNYKAGHFNQRDME